MAKERTIELRFKVDDTGSIKLEAIKGNIGKVASEVTKMDKALQIIKWDSIINLAERAGSIFRQAFDFAEMGARAKAIEDSFKSMAMNIGISGDSLIRKMKETTNATIDDTILMQKAMRGLSEGFSPDQLIKLGEAARVAARYMGIDVKSAFESVIDSLINLRERGLKTAGFVIDTEVVFKKYAETLGIGVDELNDYGKTMALVGAVIEQTKIKIETLGGLQETEFEKIQKAKTAWEEFAESIGKAASKIGDKLLPAFTSAIKFMTDNPHIMAFLTGRGLEEIITPKISPVGIVPPGIDTGLIGAGKPQIKTEVAPWDKDWIKEWAEEWNKAITAMEALGVTAEAVQEGMARSAVENLGIVKKAWMEGKASGLDYANSLKAVNDALNKLKPKDDLEDRLQVEKEYQKRLSEIMKMEASPERRDAAHELTDWWISELKRMDAVKPPSILDIPQLEADKDKSLTILKNLGMSIESNPIIQKIQIIQEFKEGGSLIPSKNSFTGASPIKWASDVEASDVEANVNFTATGMSPKIPLGDAFTKIMSNFKTMGEKTSAMESTISFAEVNNELRSLQKQYDLYERVAQERMTLIRSFSSFWANPEQSEWMKQVRGLQADIVSQMQIPKLKMAQQKYLLGFPGAEEEFYNLFRTYYNFQRGTDYVPKTGLAYIHQGEKIIPANQNHIAMGGITFNINGTQNPRAVAEEIAQILEYKRNGRLERAIQRVR